jgi:hypothetical protein
MMNSDEEHVLQTSAKSTEESTTVAALLPVLLDISASLKRLESHIVTASIARTPAFEASNQNVIHEAEHQVMTHDSNVHSAVRLGDQGPPP